VLTGPDDYFKFRWDIERSMRDSVKVIESVQEDYAVDSAGLWLHGGLLL
jgi:pyruvate ferredoxin oxidoreductase alpha subunit